ncbi:hypothetical protein TRIHO_33460 [Tritonibacter horizontis]|uniref:Uncharacterized protein n=1 Tax=Tritonibacter horizontis TaxID=1768241 RepID=A0A132BTU1_9RHOB|nr:hypothetical protein TRIHO_33460 [Tritonibacter horizontis]
MNSNLSLISRQTSRFPLRCEPNWRLRRDSCVFSITAIVSAHAKCSGLTRSSASALSPAKSVSMPGRSARTAAAVGLLLRAFPHIKRTLVIAKPSYSDLPLSSGECRALSQIVRTGSLDDAARRHKRPVRGSCTAPVIRLAKVRKGREARAGALRHAPWERCPLSAQSDRLPGGQSGGPVQAGGAGTGPSPGALSRGQHGQSNHSGSCFEPITPLDL